MVLGPNGAGKTTLMKYVNLINNYIQVVLKFLGKIYKNTEKKS